MGALKRMPTHTLLRTLRQKRACKFLAAKFCEWHLPFGTQQTKAKAVSLQPPSRPCLSKLKRKRNKNKILKIMLLKALLQCSPPYLQACSPVLQNPTSPKYIFFLRRGGANSQQQHCCDARCDAWSNSNLSSERKKQFSAPQTTQMHHEMKYTAKRSLSLTFFSSPSDRVLHVATSNPKFYSIIWVTAGMYLSGFHTWEAHVLHTACCVQAQLKKSIFCPYGLSWTTHWLCKCKSFKHTDAQLGTFRGRPSPRNQWFLEKVRFHAKMMAL